MPIPKLYLWNSIAGEIADAEQRAAKAANKA